MGTRTPIGNFIHSTWTSINLRCGKYKHLQKELQLKKNKKYKGISVDFTREEFKNWCYENKDKILSLSRPSLDRINSSLNYSLDNIQVIELTDNINKKIHGSNYKNGPGSFKPRGAHKTKNNKWEAYITFNNKGRYIGTFDTKEKAQEAFRLEYYKIRGKYPW